MPQSCRCRAFPGVEPVQVRKWIRNMSALQRASPTAKLVPRVPRRTPESKLSENAARRSSHPGTVTAHFVCSAQVPHYTQVVHQPGMHVLLPPMPPVPTLLPAPFRGIVHAMPVQLPAPALMPAQLPTSASTPTQFRAMAPKPSPPPPRELRAHAEAAQELLELSFSRCESNLSAGYSSSNAEI